MSGKKLSDEIKDFIRENYSDTTNAELTRLVNQKFGTCFSVDAIQGTKKRLDLRKQSLFPQAIQDFIRANYHGCSYRELAKQINRTFGTAYTREQVKGYCYSRNLHNDFSISKPIGSEKTYADGFSFIKVRDQPIILDCRENYELKHHYIWKQAHGPIPPGHVLIFLDGDKTNCSLENLQLVTRAEHIEMIRNKLRFSDPERTKIGVLIAKIAVAAREEKKKLERTLRASEEFS